MVDTAEAFGIGFIMLIMGFLIGLGLGANWEGNSRESKILNSVIYCKEYKVLDKDFKKCFEIKETQNGQDSIR